MSQINEETAHTKEEERINSLEKQHLTPNEDFNPKNDEKSQKKDIISCYYQNQYIKFPFIVIDIIDKVWFRILFLILLKGGIEPE